MPQVIALGSCHVVIVDNASADGSAERIRCAIDLHGWSDAVCLLSHPRNGGFAAGNNVAIDRLKLTGRSPEYVLLLNPDTEVQPDALGALVRFMDARPYTGIAGSRIDDSDHRAQGTPRRFPSPLGELEVAARCGPLTHLLRRWRIAGPSTEVPQPCDWVSGASMMIRWRVLQEVGLLDERYFLYYEEVDLCLRARRAGWQVWYVPDSRVMHVEGASTGLDRRRYRSECWFTSRRRYFVKNHGYAYAACADLARVAGLMVRRLRNLSRRRPEGDSPHTLGGLLRHGVLWNEPLVRRGSSHGSVRRRQPWRRNCGRRRFA
jgi:hypothetical protein